MAEIHYERNEDETAEAPVGVAELQRMLQEGTIGLETRVWTDGMQDWQPLGKCPDLLPKRDVVNLTEEARGSQGATVGDLTTPTGRLSFAEEFTTLLSPAGSPPGSARSHSSVLSSPQTGYASARSRGSAMSPLDGYASPRYTESRSNVLRGVGGAAALSVENLLKRMEARMDEVEKATTKNDRAARDTSRLATKIDSVERRNRELEKEVSELHQELGGLTQRVTTRVLESIDLDALERRIVRSAEEQDTKIQRAQTTVETIIRNAEVATAESLARHREQYENDQMILVTDLENSAKRQLKLVEDQVSQAKEHMGQLEEKFDTDVRPVVERCSALESTITRTVERLEADLLSTETSLRNSSEHGLQAAEERSQKLEELLRESVTSIRKAASDESIVVRDLIESTVSASTVNLSERLTELETQTREGAAATRELTEQRVSEVKETVDVYLKRANEDNENVKRFTTDSIDTLTAQTKELERAAHDELMEESAKLLSVIEENKLLLDPAVAMCREGLQQEIMALEERAAKDTQLVVKQQQKDCEESRIALERVETKIYLDAEEVAATIKTLGADLDSGLSDMEARIDETMQACDMNVLFQEANFLAVVESTAKRVDQFETRFKERISTIENTSLQRVENRLEEVYELAKGSSTHLRNTVDHKITAVERKNNAMDMMVNTLKTKMALEGDEVRETLRSLGQQIYTSIDEMEDRVDEVCSAAEMNTVLGEMAHRAHAELSALELKEKKEEIEWKEEQRQAEREARLAAKKAEILAERKRLQNEAQVEQQLVAEEVQLQARIEEQAVAYADAQASEAHDEDQASLRAVRYEREEEERLRRVQDENGASAAAALAAQLNKDTEAAAESLVRDTATGEPARQKAEADTQGKSKAEEAEPPEPEPEPEPKPEPEPEPQPQTQTQTQTAPRAGQPPPLKPKVAAVIFAQKSPPPLKKRAPGGPPPLQKRGS